MSTKKHVIIIGAGPAGLAAASRLLCSADPEAFAVTILEEAGEVGGISKTVCYQNNHMDLGGHRFFTKVDEVDRWWTQLLPRQTSETDPDGTDDVFLERSRLSRIYFNNNFFPYPITLTPSLLLDLGLADSAKVIGSYLKSLIHKREERSLEDLYINRFGKKLYEMFFEHYTENLWGVHPRDISPEWGHQRVKGLSILAVVKDMLATALHIRVKKETSLIERFRYPKFGPGQLWKKAAEQIRHSGGVIIKNAKVVAVHQEKGIVSAVSYEKNGAIHRLEGDYVVSSMPLKDLIAGMVDVPEQVRKCAQTLPYRDFMTIGVLLPKDAVVASKKNQPAQLADNWIYVHDRSVKLGRIQIFNNWSPYMVNDPEHTFWMGLEYFCDEGDALWSMDNEAFAEKACQELKTIGLIRQDAAFMDYHVERVRKAYPSYFGSYGDIQLVRDYIDEIPNLICIGRNGQHRYNNMDHSALTGFEAARYIMGVGTDKRSIWNVNTEKEYLETKQG